MMVATHLRNWSSRRVTSRASSRDACFLGVATLLFIVSAAVTTDWCASMSTMGEMPMAGGTMSMVWVPAPGHTWPGATASFLAMWIVMMVAMMLPSLIPMLWRYRQAVGQVSASRLDRLTALVAVGYFSVWIIPGTIAFPLGVALTSIQMKQLMLARAAPSAIGLVVLAAGLFQFTAWKMRWLTCCRNNDGRGHVLNNDASTAWRHGIRLGLDCSRCCANLMVILLAVGVMDLRAMAVVGIAITIERLGPASDRIARAIGAVVVATGVLLLVRATALIY